MTTRRGKVEIRLKRVYDELSPKDGATFLVDRLWPRGISKKALASVQWLREIAPSTSLRKWYGHDPDKWKEFQKRYCSELEKNEVAWKPLVDAVKKERKVTLVTSTHEVELSHLAVLRDFLMRKMAAKSRIRQSVSKSSV